MQMVMTFYNSVDVTILFDWWSVSSTGPYVGSIFVILFFGILNQFLFSLLTFGFEGLGAWFSRSSIASSQHLLLDSTVSSSAAGGIGGGKVQPAPAWRAPLIRTTLFLFTFSLSYLHMLIAMTYNAGCFLAVVFGNTIGYAVFIARRTGRNADQVLTCHTQ